MFQNYTKWILNSSSLKFTHATQYFMRAFRGFPHDSDRKMLEFVDLTLTIFHLHLPFWFRGCLESSCWDNSRKVSRVLHCKTSRWRIAWWQTSGYPREGHTHADSSNAASPTARCASSWGTLCNFPARAKKNSINLNSLFNYKFSLLFSVAPAFSLTSSNRTKNQSIFLLSRCLVIFRLCIFNSFRHTENLKC